MSAKLLARQRTAGAWQTSRRGDEMIEVLEAAGVDVRDIGFLCVERARMHALHALPAEASEHIVLAACAQVVDRKTVGEMRDVADRIKRTPSVPPKAATVVAQASWAACLAYLDAGQWWVVASEAAKAAPDKVAELAAIADIVRERHPMPPCAGKETQS